MVIYYKVPAAKPKETFPRGTAKAKVSTAEVKKTDTRPTRQATKTKPQG